MLERIKELTQLLNKAAKAYYQENTEIMSNFEYDALYDELVELEKKSGIVLANSPTVNVGYEVLSQLPKEKHPSPMLSLDKTKEPEELAAFLGEQVGVLSWKLDGLTIVLTYRDGKLYKAVTRGNGEIGEVITNNAKTFVNLPLSISFKGELIIRGEAVIKYSDFEIINASIEDASEKYKNPRNLCAGTVRQLNNEITAKRNVCFFAFSFVSADGVTKDFNNSKMTRMNWLKELGFDVVESKIVSKDNVVSAVRDFSEMIKDNDFPSDGLVLTMDDIKYSESLGRTAKFPRDSIAFKWKDEVCDTKLLYIEWSASRTGLINPVAVFEPVELEGTSVSRASIHNVSIVKELMLGKGDIISVYKANMIIPQISENKTKSGNIKIPDTCPVCGEKTVIKNDNGVETLNCVNEDCLAKKIMCFTHFVGRDAMNIEGLSQSTIEKFIGKGYIKELQDIFTLDRFREDIISMEGFGEKSYNNLRDAINKAKEVEMPKFIYGLGILGVGLANAKVICKELEYDFDKIRNATTSDIVAIYGMGEIIAKNFVDYFANEDNNRVVDNLLEHISFLTVENNVEATLEGLNFVITGSLERFDNRNALKSAIEAKGGKVVGSVSKNTDYLINNDINSSSSKNKKAKELGVEIITEEDFITRFMN